MKKKINYLFIVIISVFLYSCGNPEPQSTDFIGTWKSADGAHIILNPDGACILKDVDYFKISSFPQNKNSKLNAKGTWKFINNTESGIIDGLDSGINIIYKIPRQKLKGEIIFYISGQGFNGNNPPWSLFIWDGDPDEMNKYEFIKD